MAVDAARAKSLFLAASDLPDAADRAAYLDRECSDADVRARVEALLRANDAVPPPQPGAESGTRSHAPNGEPETRDYADPTVGIGAVLAGKYKLVEAIGEGGMGTVWMAQQTEPVRRAVAVKVVKAGMDSRAVLARFEAERQALAMMDHPNIARVLDAGTTAGGRPFFVMDLVKGTPITRYCDEHRLTPRQRLELFIPVCQAIQHAHQKGIIHRDLKPSNVLVALYDDRPVPKVIDFGVAKAAGQSLTDKTLLTGFGAVVGTPEYMSPEQASLNNLDIDTRSDVYSLGVLLYELLTGATPVDRRSLGQAALLEVLRIVREVEAPKPSAKLSTIDTLPTVAANRGMEPAKLSRLMKGELDWILLKALEKDRTRRYETANGLARDLQRYLADEVVEARPPSAGYRLKKFVRRHKGRVLAAATVAVALVIGVAAVVAVQVRANRGLAAKHAELAEEQAKVQARFDMAIKAIETFHTGISEDMLLKNAEFQELRTKLLKEAAGFYTELEKLLAGQTDFRSRQALAAAYVQLGELTDKIGDKTEALAIQRKALAIRRELAAAPGTDVETRLDVARSLRMVGTLLIDTSDLAGGLAAAEEQRELAERLEALDPTNAVRFVLAQSHHRSAWLLSRMGKSTDALDAYHKALAIRQKLVDTNPAVTQFQSDLALSHNNIGALLEDTGNSAEALEAYRKAFVIWQRLAEANPEVTKFQSDLAGIHRNLGVLLLGTGKPAEALEANRKALAIFQKLADAHPAVTEFQNSLATSHNNLGVLFLRIGKPNEALEADRKALAIFQKLADAHPTVTEFQSSLATIHGFLGDILSQTGRFAEALEPHSKGLAIRQTLADAHPTVTGFQKDLAEGHNTNGWDLSQTGKPAEALVAYRQALAIMQTLVDANPTVTECQCGLANIHANLGRLHASQKRFDEAFAALETSLAISRKLVAADPTTLAPTVYLGWGHAFRGWARVRAGQPAEAATDLRRAVELWARIPALELEVQLERLRVLALLAGLGADAKSGVTATEAAAFADQAVDALRDIVKAGWVNASELKEPDFDALRGRADFQKLVADLAAKHPRKPDGK
jgi:serine/threonine protein kinase/tetratricopeptide (TPR) repeat protein